jgi:hypothetical protein
VCRSVARRVQLPSCGRAPKWRSGGCCGVKPWLIVRWLSADWRYAKAGSSGTFKVSSQVERCLRFIFLCFCWLLRVSRIVTPLCVSIVLDWASCVCRIAISGVAVLGNLYVAHCSSHVKGGKHHLSECVAERRPQSIVFNIQIGCSTYN